MDFSGKPDQEGREYEDPVEWVQTAIRHNPSSGLLEAGAPATTTHWRGPSRRPTSWKKWLDCLAGTFDSA